MRFEFDDDDKATAREVVDRARAVVEPVIDAARPFAEAATLFGLGATKLFRAAKKAGFLK